MLRSVKELYLLLTPAQRSKLFRLQILIILMSFAEIAGVASIGPFMALVGDMSLLEGEGVAAELYRLSGIGQPADFLFWLGIAVLAVLALASVISMFTVWRLCVYGAHVGAELGNRLYRYYMHQPWMFHANVSSSHLTKQISQETLRMTNFVISPLMYMNAKLVMSALMGAAVFLYNPVVALVGISIFVICYFLLFVAVRRHLAANGRIISETQSLRYKLMAEGFGGIKDALLLGRQKTFIDRFEDPSRRFASAAGTNQAMSQVPRYAMELVAFSSVIFLVLYLLASHQGNLGTILPVLSIYALAGFKILPALQKVYSSASSIRGNLASFESVRDDLHASSQYATGMPARQESGPGQEQFVPRRAITLDNVVFSYPGTRELALNGVSLEVPANQMIGLVGASGSGKSTVIDVLLGLIDPTSGRIMIDDHPLTPTNRRAWQNTIGFVPQSIYLSDASIRENIAFGLAPEDIDEVSVKRAANMANLDELLDEMPNGLDTCVGERGVQLSGGQRQRIGIARALYHDAEVLILDEATSALDGITEKVIMDSIHDFMGKKTIIMIAHRLATVKQCNRIYLMKAGRVIDAGSYAELSGRNEIFKRMVEHS
ncbi:ABC transporter ATP-binding protein [Halomonas cerina]|uniref:HlyD family secretion protein n=1 Tax=Halomonas cerina TaxID=447424 RepID=A0A839V9L3_9GAMM|nr:ABC transporter ATP-binding protein [Halomonas cerina]MBB3189394.1 HlyD family secretion protein [Halomonas cerina]